MKGHDRARKVVDIRERTMKYAVKYAVRAIKLFCYLQRTRDEAARVIAKQFLRSATSIGANLAEALSGESRKDFIHKYGIAQKEARESLYWLTLLHRSGIVCETRVTDLIGETNQIVAILTAIVVKAKANSPAA